MSRIVRRPSYSEVRGSRNSDSRDSRVHEYPEDLIPYRSRGSVDIDEHERNGYGMRLEHHESRHDSDFEWSRVHSDWVRRESRSRSYSHYHSQSHQREYDPREPRESRESRDMRVSHVYDDRVTERDSDDHRDGRSRRSIVVETEKDKDKDSSRSASKSGSRRHRSHFSHSHSHNVDKDLDLDHHGHRKHESESEKEEDDVSTSISLSARLESIKGGLSDLFGNSMAIEGDLSMQNDLDLHASSLPRDYLEVINSIPHSVLALPTAPHQTLHETVYQLERPARAPANSVWDQNVALCCAGLLINTGDRLLLGRQSVAEEELLARRRLERRLLERARRKELSGEGDEYEVLRARQKEKEKEKEKPRVEGEVEGDGGVPSRKTISLADYRSKRGIGSCKESVKARPGHTPSSNEGIRVSGSVQSAKSVVVNVGNGKVPEMKRRLNRSNGNGDGNGDGVRGTPTSSSETPTSAGGGKKKRKLQR